MIPIKDILTDVMGRMDLTRRSDIFSMDMFYRALNRSLRKANGRFKILQKAEPITGTEIFTLDSSVRPLHILEISWPSTWTLPLRRKSIQEMNNILRVINNGTEYYPEDISSSQPSFWAFYPNDADSTSDSPGSHIRVANASMVTEDVDITVRYSYLPIYDSRITSKDATLDVGEEYFDLLSLHVARELSSRYAPDKYAIFHQEYGEALEDIRVHRRRIQSHEAEHTDFLKW